MDFVQRLMYREQEYLFHVEFQLRHAQDFPRRLFVYSALLTEQFGLPVITVALMLERTDRSLPEAYTVRLGKHVTNAFRYRVLRLWDYEEDIRSGKLKELSPLLVMVSKRKDAEVLRQERELILEERDRKKRADLLACAVTIASRYFERDFLWEFFKEEVNEMRGSTIIEEWIEEAAKETREQALREGREQGHIQTLREDIIAVLEERFDVVTPEMVEQLKKVDHPEVLRMLFRKALILDSVEEFVEVMARTAGRKASP